MTQRHVLMIAAENDGLQGGKVGGIGDVVRDLPPALGQLGWRVSIATPSYGFLHKIPGSSFLGHVTPRFRGVTTHAGIHSVPGKKSNPGVTHYVFDHPGFTWTDRGQYQIYRRDSPDRPFASDASKYALFCAAVAEAARHNLFGQIHCMHLHDWHAAFLLILRKYHPEYESLKPIHTVYTIHNLALQGIRPLQGDESSLKSWYPDVPIGVDRKLTDPRWPNCVNPMAVGIRLADMVHTVSPSYAEEILKPSEWPSHYGGEGLEADLVNAKQEGRLVGILNGCEYPEHRKVARLKLPDLLDHLRSQVLMWSVAQESVSAPHLIALERLRDLRSCCDEIDLMLTSVTRVTDQKMFLLRAAGSDGLSGLQGVLDALGEKGAYILLGTGDPEYEHFLATIAAQHQNFVFLNGYSDLSASALYANGDLFLMPSSFEPCGISQMLAMRDGQPCLVHAVGGLKDTVKDAVDGITFEGTTVRDQVDEFRQACRRAADLKRNNRASWAKLVKAAAARRFKWEDTVGEYVAKLYGHA